MELCACTSLFKVYTVNTQCTCNNVIMLNVLATYLLLNVFTGIS